MSDLETVACPKEGCGGTAVEVVWAERSCRQGWLCPSCHTFKKATGRERLIKTPKHTYT